MAGDFNLRGMSRNAYTARILENIDREKVRESEATENPVLPLWLEPPPYLTDREAHIWRYAVKSRGVEWLKPIDTIALEEYCRTCTEIHNLRPFVMGPKCTKDQELRWRRAHQQMMRYATLLGLTVAGRLDFSKRTRQSTAETPAKMMAQRAAENAADPLLQGYGAPPDDDAQGE